MNAPNLPQGTRLGTFEVDGLLGRGGMGAVYRARDLVTGRAVALKVLATEASEDPRALQRFEREARAAAALQHPNLATVLAVDLDPRMPWVALELLPGGSLQDRLKRSGPIPWPEAARLGVQIARALVAVHAAGFVHRDLKPANVLLDSVGTAKLTDFGLVRTAGGQGVAQSLTRTGELLGTLEFVAPEQVDAARRVDSRADLYSFGATLYALVSGAPPFEGAGYSLVKKHLQDAPRPPRELVPDLPPRFERLILALLAKAPAQRPASAAAVALELEAIASAEGKPGAEPTRRGPVLGAVAAVAVTGAVAGAFVLGQRSGPGGGPTPSPAASTPAATGRPSPASTPTPPAPEGLRDLPGAHRSGWHDLGEGRPRLAAVLGDPGLRHSDAMWSVALSPDGKAAFTTSVVGVRRSDLERGTDDWSTAHAAQRKPYHVAVSPSGDTLAVATATGCELVDPDSGSVRRSTGSVGESYATAWSPDGTCIVGAGGPGSVWLFYPRLGKGSLLEPTLGARAFAVAFSPSGKLVAGAAETGVVAVWNIETGTEVARFGADTPENGSTAVAFLDDAHLVAGQGLDIVVWDLGSKAVLARGAGHERPIWGLAVAPGGRTFFTGADDWTVRRWRLDPSGKLAGEVLARTQGIVRSLALSREGDRIAAAGTGLSVFSTADGKLLSGTRGHAWQVAAIAPLGRDRVATAGRDGTVRIWDAATGAPRAVVPFPRELRTLVASEDRKTLWTSDEQGRVVRIDGADTTAPVAREIKRLEDGGPVTALARVGAGPLTQLLVAQLGGQLLALDARTGDVRADTSTPVPGMSELAVTDDGQGVLAMAGGLPQSYRLTERNYSRVATPYAEDQTGPRHSAIVHGMAVVPRSGTTISGDEDGRLLVWEWDRTTGALRWTGTEVRDRDPHAWVWGVAASPDGRFVATGSWDGAVHLHDARALARGESTPRRIDLGRVEQAPMTLAFSADSLYVGTASGIVLRFDLAGLE